MNLTLAVDEAVVERAREVARQQGTSLNALIRDYLEQLAGQIRGEQLVAELQAMWAESDRQGDRSTEPYRFDREAIYRERVDRRRRS